MRFQAAIPPEFSTAPFVESPWGRHTEWNVRRQYAREQFDKTSPPSHFPFTINGRRELDTTLDEALRRETAEEAAATLNERFRLR